MWGYAPHTRTREFLPGPGTQWDLDLRNRRVSVWSGRGNDVGLCTPHPHQGVPPWTRFTMELGLKESTGFCVRQQERMCCCVSRQRLSVRSGPGQPVDRGFSACRVPGESLFSPGSIIRKPLPAAGNMAVTQHNPTPHAETLCITRQLSSRDGGAGESFPCFGVWGRRAPKDSPARGRPSFTCWGCE